MKSPLGFCGRGSWDRPGRGSWVAQQRPDAPPSQLAQRSPAHPRALLPHPGPPSLCWTFAPGCSCSPNPSAPCSIPEGISLKKLRFDHAILLLDVATDWPQLLVWHSRPPQSSPAYLLITLTPALPLQFLGTLLPLLPYACALQRLIPLPGTSSLPCHWGKLARPSPTLPPRGHSP